MKYSLEFKLECVEKYKKGERVCHPGTKAQRKNFMKHVRLWARHYDEMGLDGLRHSGKNRKWTAEGRLALVSKVLSGLSIAAVAAEARVNSGQLCRWVKSYRENGMIGLDMKAGRKRKKPGPGPGPERAQGPVSEAEELAVLRERNRFLEIENAYLKKLDALVSEREAAEAKAKRRKP